MYPIEELLPHRPPFLFLDRLEKVEDEEVVGYDPDARLTGYHGRFVVPNAPTGAVTLEVGYEIEDEPVYSIYYYVYVPVDGVAPVYPAYVEVF